MNITLFAGESITVFFPDGTQQTVSAPVERPWPDWTVERLVSTGNMERILGEMRRVAPSIDGGSICLAVDYICERNLEQAVAAINDASNCGLVWSKSLVIGLREMVRESKDPEVGDGKREEGTHDSHESHRG